MFNPFKKKEGYTVHVSDNVKSKLETLPPEVREEINNLIKGFEDGSIDPAQIGTKLCGYCGEPIKGEICDCAKNLV